MSTSTQSPVRPVVTLEDPGDARRPTRTGSDFERLYAEFMPRVRGLVRKLVHDSDLVDDLVQETFLRAYHGGLHLEYQKAHPDHTQWPWLAAVARNLSLDVLRRRKVVVEHELEEHDVLSEAGSDDPEVCLLASRRRESISEALASVSERHRRILLMKVVEGKRYEEIAAAEGISVEALKSVLARARRTFRASYATIAQRRGLGVLVGGGVLRGVSARLRAFRDRVAPGFQEGLANLAASAPAALNAAVTAVVLGSVAAAGAFLPHRTSSGDATPAPVVHSAPAPVQSTPVADDVPEPDLPPPAPDPEPPAPAAEVPPPAEPPPPAATPPPTVPTEASASVDTDDYVPIEDPPAGGEGDGTVKKWDGGAGAGLTHDIDLDGDGEPDDAGGTGAAVNCPPPGERSEIGNVVCPVLLDEA